jgi:hypothetical protein
MRPFRPTSTERLESSLCAWGRARDGGVAVTVAVTSAVLVGVLAIAIDLGRAYNLSTELDNAADAYALAGATQLDQTPGSCVRAMQAAIDVSLGNTETFASNTATASQRQPGEVFIDRNLDPFNNNNIRFLERVNKDANGRIIGDYIDVLYSDIADCDANAQQIEVFIDQASQGDPYRVGYSFAGIIGAATETFPKGYAIAESADLTCGFVPMMICPVNPLGAPVTETAQEWYDNHIASYDYNGYGLWMKAGKQNVQWDSGNFGWLRVGNMNGAKDLSDAIGMVNPPELCIGDETVETEPGSKSGARQAFNTRFDIWEGSVKSNQGDSNWQPAPNQVKGKKRNAVDRCDIAPSGSGGDGYSDPDTPYAGPGTNPSPQMAMPMPRDNCAYGGLCESLDNLGRLGDGNWDSSTYTTNMHPSPVGLLPTGGGSWDIDWDAGGLHPDLRISRYEMYLWEMGRAHNSTDFACTGGGCTMSNMVDETGAPAGAGDFPQAGEYGGVQCFSGTMGDNGGTVTLDHDRRVVEALVVDCEGVKADQGGLNGNTTIKPEFIIGEIELFLVEPWVVKGGDHEIYVEVIGPGEASGFENTVQETIVWIVE